MDPIKVDFSGKGAGRYRCAQSAVFRMDGADNIGLFAVCRDPGQRHVPGDRRGGRDIIITGRNVRPKIAGPFGTGPNVFQAFVCNVQFSQVMSTSSVL